jgi:hypothetical protein
LASIEATPFPGADEDYRFQGARFLSMRQSCAATKSPTRVGFGRQERGSNVTPTGFVENLCGYGH